MKFNKKSREFYKAKAQTETFEIDFNFNYKKTSKIPVILVIIFILVIPVYGKTFENNDIRKNKNIKKTTVKINNVKKELLKEEIKEEIKKEEKKPEEKIYTIPKKIKKKEIPKKEKPEIGKVEKKEPEKVQEELIEQKDVWGMNSDNFAKNSSGNGIAIKAGNNLNKEYDYIEVEKDKIPPKKEEPQIDENKEYEKDEVTAAPKFLQRISPKYTSEALEDEIEGVVIIMAVINNDGSIISVKIKQKLGYGLDEEAIKALKNSKLSPAKVGEFSVKCIMEFSYRFKITRR